MDGAGKHPIGDARHGRRRPRNVRQRARRRADRRIRRVSGEADFQGIGRQDGRAAAASHAHVPEHHTRISGPEK